MPPKNLKELSSLVEIVSALRGPDGCPWDKEQTHLSLAQYAVEETSELVEAIESADDAKTKDELGDVLFQVVLHAQLASERKAFDLSDVIENLNLKMVRRHPHVFGDGIAENSAAVIQNWEAVKKQEKASRGESTSVLDVPVHLPALQRSAKIGSRTRKLKFDWENAEQVMEKVREEFAELEETLEEGSDETFRHELGDVLFSLAQLARHWEMDPEQVLRDGNRRFENRFNAMMAICRERSLNWDSLSNDEKEELWSLAKERVG